MFSTDANAIILTPVFPLCLAESAHQEPASTGAKYVSHLLNLPLFLSCYYF